MIISPRWTFLFLLCALAFSRTLEAQEIIAQERFSGSLFSIDPKTGESTFIATPPLGGGKLWNCLAYDSQGTLYAANGDWAYGWDIYEIDPDTAQTVFVTYVAINGFSSMAFDDNDTLYFINDRDAPLIVSPADLHTLDLATGIHTLIGDTGLGISMNALDFHDGVLYAHPSSIGLTTIDTNTGLGTDLEPSHPGIIGGWTVGFSFDNQGALYFLTDFLWLMDPETTTSSIVDWVPPFPLWGECVFREGPTPNFSLTLSGFAGSPMTVKIAGATPFGQVAIVAARGSGGPTTIPAGFPCAGVELDLNSTMRLLGVGTANVDGYVEVGPDLMPAGAVGNLRVQAIDLSSCETTNKVIVTY